VKPFSYDITFSIEKVIEMGTIEMAMGTQMETDQKEAKENKDTEPKLDEEEAARASKK
jgi:hypothetical protein